MPPHHPARRRRKRCNHKQSVTQKAHDWQIVCILTTTYAFPISTQALSSRKRPVRAKAEKSEAAQIVARRTAQANQVRGLLLEYGIIIPKGISYIRRQIPLILEDADNGLSNLFRQLLNDLYLEFVHLDERVDALEETLKALCAQSEDCQRLLTIPGVGLLSATALVAAIGDIRAFKNGRELAAWLGLVPRQHSTGGKTTLMGISKRGDTYLRTLLIHGGRTVVRVAEKHQDRKNQWVCEVEQRRGKNIAAVAVANKNARIVWALLSKQTTYQKVAA